MQVVAAVILAVVALSTAGCITPGADADRDQRLTGWFSDWNDDIEADFGATIEPYDVDAIFMESFPPGFSVSPMTKDDCDGLRSTLISKDYIASVGDCRPMTGTIDGDGTTSSSA